MNDARMNSRLPHAVDARAPRVRIVSAAVAALVVAQTLRAAPARAQDDPSSSDIAAARALAVDGVKLADAGRCNEAIDKLARAEKLHHAAIVLGRLGECQVAQGKIVDGTESLRRVLREPLPPGPSPALLKVRERAQTLLETAKTKIAALTISVKGPRENTGITVTVDGQAVPAALLDTERPTDPGDHLVEASAVGFTKASARVALGPADKQAVTLKLEADGSAVASPAAVPPSGDGASPATRVTAQRDPGASTTMDSAAIATGSPNHTPAYLAWGIGGVGLATGAVFGALALKGKSDLNGECRSNVCGPQSEDHLNAAKLNGTISTVAFAAGGGAIVLGTILYLAAGSSGPSAAQGGASHGSRGAAVHASARPWIGLGQAGVVGEF